MATVKKVEEKLTQHSRTGANTYMIPSKNMDNWYKDELLFVRKVEAGCAVVFRSMDGKLYSLNDKMLLNFKLL
tara:strand:- start:5202 stop:5420 length:219 start_codon:yes stop_codon:yes gene_type:complete